MNYTDEQLGAYVDDEMSAEERQRFEHAMEQDAELKARVAEQQALTTQIKGVFDQVLNEPVPDRLLQAVQSGAGNAPESRDNTIDLATERARRATKTTSAWRWPQLGAIAASLIVGVFLGRGAFETESALFSTGDTALVASTAFSRVLDTQSSAATGGAVLTGLSFKDSQDRYCRSFSTTVNAPLSGVACRTNQDWTIELLVPAQAAQQGDFRLAGSATHPEVLRYIDTHGRGATLDADAESKAMRAGWTD